MIRILWATPFNVKSAIGTFSSEVCNELMRRGYSIQIMRIESGTEAALPALPIDALVWGSDDPIPLDIDLVVINYGNHAPYHAGALRLAAAYPALSIFHDAEMRHFAAGMIERHQIHVPSLYGPSGKDPHGLDFDLVDPDARPLLLSLSALGACSVVHGPHYLAAVAESCPGPVEVIPLCFPNIGAADAAPSRSPKLSVTIFGIISRYKQPDRLLKAIAMLSEDFGAIEIHFAGTIEDWYRDALTGIAMDLGIPSPIFHGYLPDKELSNLLHQSTAVCCLRYPVTEGGSASLITALYHARPLVVSDVASYALTPDDLVYKVPYGDDVNSLAQALREIFNNPQTSDAKALAARDWARNNFSASAYVDKLEPLIDTSLAMMPALLACRQLATTACYAGGEVMLPALKQIAEVVNELYFCSEE
ncbi:glycosyltransferase family 4 protein [Sphingobium algorifonticola]|uniref:Glycosyltransferase n=1 Tax=Sphingobium algorifonticola TaxID=2008318 RepID=A0A437J533_9SPHN|nr:glycosyltransferase family 4 protein [Sphingobium algorifonticola]RVT39822.1 glycosyltransferase [Sphingobium algorifonticola]